MKRRLSISFVLTLLLMTLATVPTFAAKPITVYINNTNEIQFDVAPIIINDRTMVPMRAIFEAFDMYVEWNQSTQKIYICEENYCTELTINDTTARQYRLLDGITDYPSIAEIPKADIVTKTMDVAPKIINGRTLVPVRFILETIGYDVTWDAANCRVNIITDLSNPNNSLSSINPAPTVTADTSKDDLDIPIMGNWSDGYSTILSIEKEKFNGNYFVFSANQPDEDNAYCIDVYEPDYTYTYLLELKMSPLSRQKFVFDNEPDISNCNMY